MVKKAAKILQTQWMKMAQLLKVDKSRNINADPRTITKEETSDVVAERSTSHTLLSTLTLRLNIVERHRKERIPHNFKQVEGEEGQEKFMLKLASRKKIAWTHLFKDLSIS